MYYIYPVKPVVPLCDVHPEFGKVTTLNRENTKTTKLIILEQNLPQNYLLKNCFYNFSLTYFFGLHNHIIYEQFLA